MFVAVAFALYFWAVWIVTARRVGDIERRKWVRRGFALLGAFMSVGWFWTFASDMRVYAADIAHHTALPVITLTLVFFAQITLLTRSSMLETLKEDYILTARAKGIPERVIRDRHAARNALLPVTTSFVLALAAVIGGGIVTESIFSWPGIGLTLLNAVLVEDIPLAIGGLALIGALSLVGHLVVDILYTFLDPRIRYA
jgi:peptide/nickel transport system permease protein